MLMGECICNRLVNCNRRSTLARAQTVNDNHSAACPAPQCSKERVAPLVPAWQAGLARGRVLMRRPAASAG